jgi:hypothetical protein
VDFELYCVVENIFVVGYCEKRLSCKRVGGETGRGTGWFTLALLPAVFERSITAKVCNVWLGVS